MGEIVRLLVGDVHVRRGALAVWRTKRKPQVRETLAMGRELRAHLAQFRVFLSRWTAIVCRAEWIESSGGNPARRRAALKIC